MPADDPAAAALIYVPPPARSPLPWSRDFSFRVGSRDAFNGQHTDAPLRSLLTAEYASIDVAGVVERLRTASGDPY